jgi:uncharacterized membrane protein YeaQ/YmgE (transglycosylase-associated protein family)
MNESEEPLYCVNHPKTETWLRCNRCGNPICPKCAVRTPVGFRCKQCIKGQQAVFYSATPLDYLIAVVIGLVASLIAGTIMNRLGWFLALFLGPLVGGIIAEAVRWAIGRRRGRWMWLVVSACIVVGALVGPLFIGAFLLLTMPQGGSYLLSSLGSLLFRINFIYVALAVGTVYARLR